MYLHSLLIIFFPELLKITCIYQSLTIIALFEVNGRCCAANSLILSFFHCYVDKPAMLLRQKQF